MNHCFMMQLDFGDLGSQDVDVEYTAEKGDYKPMDMFVYWRGVEVTDYLRENISDEVYEVCCQHLVEYRNGGQP